MQRDIELVGIADLVGGDQPRPKGFQRVGAFAFGPLRAPFELKDPFRHVVAHAEARDVTHGVFNRNIRTRLTEHDCELCLPVELGAPLGHHHRVVGPVNGAGGSQHEHGFFGRLEARLGSVLAIGQRAADDFAGSKYGRP